MSFPHTRTLPSLGTHETDTLDFKGGIEGATDGKVDRFELAKDIAAMANGLGGTLLIGAYGGTSVTKYKAMPRESATRLAKEYEEAVRDLCRPTPQAHAEPLSNGDGDRVVLAIHVFPHPFPVAVRCTGNGSKDAGGWGGSAWVFFSRVMSHTKEFSPEMLPMLTPNVRRMSILLRSIPTGADITLSRQATAAGAHSTSSKGLRLVGVDDEKNAFVLQFPTAVTGKRSVPLDMVRTIYKAAEGMTWYIDMLPYNDVN